MATNLLSEEKLLCSVCLDVFTEPVSTPCGHNFCSSCIYEYWASSHVCQCPLCNRAFSRKPELQLNTFISELAAEFKTSVQVKPSTPDPPAADILCDICSDIKKNAVKSCLSCLVSYCKVHLEPHQRVAVLRGHTLLDPVKNLDERICKAHHKITELYCRTDQTCICVLCFKTDHRSHDVVPLEEEHEAVMAKKDETMADIQKMMQSRREKIAEIENAAGVSHRQAEKETKASLQVFTDLISTLQRSQAELVQVIEDWSRTTKQKAEGFLTELRKEVAELQSRSNQLEQLSQSGDHHLFLQSFPTLSSPLDTDWTDVVVDSDLSFGAMRDAVTVLKQRVDEIMEAHPEIRMKRMRKHAVELTFDPDTAYDYLVISQDGKQVTNSETSQNRPPNPKRFDKCEEVLAKEGFTAGKFYYEVQVEGKINLYIGVAGESVDRKENTALSVENAYYTIGLDEDTYYAYATPIVKITLKDELQKVGIFVDYDNGEISFYDANSKSHLYSFTGYHFTETLYPYFYIDGTNSTPLIITPVPLSHSE